MHIKKFGFFLILVGFFTFFYTLQNVQAGPISSSWNQMSFPDDTFWNDSPTTGEIIKAYYGTSGDRLTAFTQYRSGQTHSCDFDSFQVVMLDAGSGDQLPNNFSGSTIYVLSGTFNFWTMNYTGTRVFLGSCVALLGSQNASLVKTGNQFMTQTTSSGFHLIYHRLTFDGIDPNGGYPRGGSYFNSARDITISHITGHNVQNTVFIDLSSRITIQHSHLSGNGANSIQVNTTTGIVIQNNIFINNGIKGDQFVGGQNRSAIDLCPGRNTIVSGNLFSGHRFNSQTKAIRSECSTTGSIITNNTFINNRVGFQGDGASASFLANNYCTLNDRCFIFNGGEARAIFSGNLFSGDILSSVEVYSATSGINNIFLNSPIGIYTQSTPTFTNNTFANNGVALRIGGGAGVRVNSMRAYNGKTSTYAGQGIYGGTGGVGIRCENCTNTRINNVAIFNQGIGIEQYRNTNSGLTISNSQIYNNTYYGIDLSTSSGSHYIHNTQIYNNGTGLLARTGTRLNNVGLFNNTFNGSGGVVYGTLSVLGSSYNPHEFGSGSDALVANVGWTTGSITTLTGEMSCEYVSIPTRGRYPGLSSYGRYPGSNACGAIGKVSTDSGTNTQYPLTGFIIGQNILLQTQPIRLSGSALVYDTFLSYNTGYYIALLDDNHDFVDFTPVTGVALSTLTTSSTGSVQGVTTTASISVSGGEMSINGGAFTSTPTTVVSGDTVRVRRTSSASLGTTVGVTVTIGSAQSSFLITTLLDTAPDSFSFTNVTNASLNSSYPSNTIILTGMSSGASTGISITGGGLYKINSGAYTGNDGIVFQGDSVTVFLTSANAYSSGLTTVLTIGNQSGSYTVTTQAQPTGGGGGGGGGGSPSPTTDNCPGGDYSASYYDGTCGTPPGSGSSSTGNSSGSNLGFAGGDIHNPLIPDEQTHPVSQEALACLVIPSNLTYQQKKIKNSFDKLITPYQSSPSDEKIFLTNLQTKVRNLMQQSNIQRITLSSNSSQLLSPASTVQSLISSSLVSRARGIESLLQFFDFLVSKRLQQLQNNGSELVGRPSPDQIMALLNTYNVTTPEFLQSLMSDSLFTREEAAYFYTEFAEKVLCKKPIVPRSSCLFNDLSSSNPAYTEAIIRSCELGIFEGFEDGSFQPKNLFLGKEVVTTVIRLIYDGSILGISGENRYQPFLDKASAIKLVDQFHNSKLFLDNGVDKFGVASLVYRAPFIWAF